MCVYMLAMHIALYTRQMQIILLRAKAKCIVLQKLEIWHCTANQQLAVAAQNVDAAREQAHYKGNSDLHSRHSPAVDVLGCRVSSLIKYDLQENVHASALVF